MKITFENGENVVEAEQWVPCPVGQVFDFFSSERNLEKLTPPTLSFLVLGKSTPSIQEGTLIDYQLRIHGVPTRWRTRIEEWRPGVRFVDTQLTGPYKLWHHTHTFEAKDGGTLMKDRVRYRLPLGWLGNLVAGRFVKQDVRRIFEYRREVISRIFR